MPRCRLGDISGSRAGASEMSTERAHGVAGTSADIPAPPPAGTAALPVDLQLEIFARSDDAATVLRCAAASRSLRRFVLGPDFRAAFAVRTAASGGFHPAHLVAVSYRIDEGVDLPPAGTSVHTSRRLPFDVGLLRSFEPASSRDGHLVLWRDQRLRSQDGSRIMSCHEFEVELRVCSAFTGHVTSLPRMSLGRGGGTMDLFRPALLAVDGTSRGSFELLVMERFESAVGHLKARIFSSQNSEWGDLRQIYLPPGVISLREATSTTPAVIGRAIHWLCITVPEQELFVLVLHDEAVQAMMIGLPEDCRTRMDNTSSNARDDRFIMAVTSEGTRLSLVVAENLVISMWTLSPDEDPSSGGDGSWSRHVLIRRREIDRPLTTGLKAYSPIRFDGYGERSGVVLFWMQGVGLVQLNLGTKKSVVLRRCGDSDCVSTAKAFLLEIHLVSLLQAMIKF